MSCDEVFIFIGVVIGWSIFIFLLGQGLKDPMRKKRDPNEYKWNPREY